MHVKTEFRVRKVERFIVTKYEETDKSGGSSVVGEYSSYEAAHAVGYALAKAESERYEYAPGDTRVIYPEPDLESIGQIMSGTEAGHTFG